MQAYSRTEGRQYWSYVASCNHSCCWLSLTRNWAFTESVLNTHTCRGTWVTLNLLETRTDRQWIRSLCADGQPRAETVCKYRLIVACNTERGLGHQTVYTGWVLYYDSNYVQCTTLRPQNHHQPFKVSAQHSSRPWLHLHIICTHIFLFMCWTLLPVVVRINQLIECCSLIQGKWH
jgi:hypothetical protein